MAVDKKNRIKRAVLSWLCVAALVSGPIPDSFSGIIPTMTAAAEAPVTYDAVIDLTQLEDYKTNNPFGDKVAVDTKRSDDMGRYIGSYYRIDIKESGTYLLKGSNFINGAYVDVNFRIGDNVDADIICDGAYIKNVIIEDFALSGEADITHSYVNVFQTTNTNSTLNLSGTLAIERTYCNSHDTFSDYLGGNTSSITADFFEVTYTDADGNSLGKTAYLSGGTYKDKSGNTDGKCTYTMNGTEKVPFDPTNITAAATVICDDHTLDANGKCQNCDEVWLIDLAKLIDYKNGTAECPYGLTFKTPENFDDILEVTFTKSGTYKFTGSNFINGAYLDIKFIVADGVNVTLDCDDAFLKNDKGVRVENVNCNDENYPTNEPVYSHELVASGYFTLYNHVHPFSVGNNATVNFTGKLFVDTFSEDNYVSMFDDYSDMPRNIYGIYYNLNGSSHGKKFFVSGAEYDLSDYAVDFHCIRNIENNSQGIYTFSRNWLNAYVYTHHNIPEGSDTCTQCSLQFDNIYTVTVDDGINTPSTHRVAEGDTFDCPADPAAPVGKKFAGWYVADTEYNFITPVTSNITITAHYEDSLVKSVALAQTSNVDDEYIEGNTFDPTGLIIDVTYDDNRTETISYDENNTKFSFAPLLTAELATTDNNVTVSYGTAMAGGSNSVDIPITVVAKQLSGIAIKTAPKISYIEGEPFNPTGLVITATYNNGKSEDIAYNENTAGDFTFDKNVLALGDNAVKITYGGEEATLTVSVTEKTIDSIAVKTEPTKTAYIEGESFDPAGLVITATYDNGKSEDIAYNETTASDFTFDKDVLALGDNAVKITYGGEDADLTVSVSEKTVASIAVKTEPTKTAYIEGESFDPAGLVITATYDNGKSEDIAYSENSGITFAPAGALTTADTKVTITFGSAFAEQQITVAKKSSGGGSAGGNSRPSRPVTPSEPNPSVDGSSKSWSEVAADLSKLPVGSEVTIDLNGSTKVPVEIIKAIDERDLKVTFVVDGVKSWKTDGAQIKTPAAADLSITKTTGTNPAGLDGIEGTQFRINDTGIPADLSIAFKTKHAGKAANLYKVENGKFTLISRARIGADGKVVLPNVTEKGDYIVMIGEPVALTGDIDGDGIVDMSDAIAIADARIRGRKIDVEYGDFNGDGVVNIYDSVAIAETDI